MPVCRHGVQNYTALYGTLSEQSPFGDRVWAGLAKDFLLYQYAYQMTGRRYMGWFLCPRSFSRAHAGQPRVVGDSEWYPAVFCGNKNEVMQMACLHIVLIGCRIWWVDSDRIVIVGEMN